MEIGGIASSIERTDRDSSVNIAASADHNLTIRRVGAILDTDRHNWVYFIGTATGSPFKVGMAYDVAKRLQTLQIGNPQRLVVLVAAQSRAAADAEFHFHEAFRKNQLVGEWFDWSDEAAGIIAGMARGCPDILRPIGATGQVLVGNRYCRFELGAMSSWKTKTAPDHRQVTEGLTKNALEVRHGLR